jgi:hypothetical protein
MLKSNHPGLSRREFLTTAVGAGGAMLLRPAWLSAAGDGVDPRVARRRKLLPRFWQGHGWPRLSIRESVQDESGFPQRKWLPDE